LEKAGFVLWTSHAKAFLGFGDDGSLVGAFSAVPTGLGIVADVFAAPDKRFCLRRAFNKFVAVLNTERSRIIFIVRTRDEGSDQD